MSSQRPPRYLPGPLKLNPGFVEMLASEQHYRVTEMHCVDYTGAPEPDPFPGWKPLLDVHREPAQPSRWARLRGRLRRRQP
jgi:hypothetical protein